MLNHCLESLLRRLILIFLLLKDYLDVNLAFKRIKIDSKIVPKFDIYWQFCSAVFSTKLNLRALKMSPSLWLYLRKRRGITENQWAVGGFRMIRHPQKGWTQNKSQTALQSNEITSIFLHLRFLLYLKRSHFGFVVYH